MKIISGKHLGRSRRSGILATFTVLAILGAGPSAFGGSGLNGGATDVGIDVSDETSPYTHTTDITLESSGDTTGTLTDVSFDAIGLGSENEVDIENEGAVSVTATGGVAAEGADVDTQLTATGIETLGGVTNSGAVTATATSTDATAQGGEDAAAYSGTDDSDAGDSFRVDSSNGIYAEGKVVNSGSITVTTASGAATATADQDADAYSTNYATGILTYAADVSNSGEMTISVTTGNASATSDHEANASSSAGAGAIVSEYDSNDGTVEDAATNVTNTGNLSVSVSAGDATAIVNEDSTKETKAEAEAEAVGIMVYGDYEDDPTEAPVSNVVNSGDISVSAASGKAAVTDNITTATEDSRATSDAYTIGIYSVTNNENATETSASGNITNSGDITATATSENVTAAGEIVEAYSDAGFLGIQTSADGFSDAGGSEAIAVVDNSGDITLNAASGSSDATGSDDAYAYSSIKGAGIYAAGDSIGADDTIESDTDTEDVYGNVDNTGNISIDFETGTSTATGKVDASAVSYAYAFGIYAVGSGWTDIYGADAFGNVTNSGDITLNASIADAETSATYDPEATESYIYAYTDIYNYTTGINASGWAYVDSEETIDAEADGVDTYGTVTNDGAVSITTTAGNLTADATAEDTASADAGVWADTTSYGITASGYDGSETDAYGTDALGDVTNSGAISVAATIGNLDAGATAVDGNAYANADSYTTAVGINAGGDLENTGGVTVSTTGGTVTAETESNNSARAYATSSSTALGLGYSGDSDIGFTSASFSPLTYAESYVGGDITNSGTVTVSTAAGNATAEGDEASAEVTSTAVGITTGGIGVTYGYLSIDDTESESSTVNNSGAITVTATAGNAVATGGTDGVAVSNADARGIDNAGDITNSGDITASATTGSATATVTGETEVTAEANTVAQALGIFTESGTVNNSGDIIIAASAGSVVTTDTGDEEDSSVEGLAENSVLAVGISAENESDVANSGDITVTAAAESDEAYAFGIFLQNGGNLTNTGIIRTTGDKAYEVTVVNGTLTLKDAYNMTLDADPAVGSICTAGDAVIDINDAALALSTTEDTQWETEYKIFEVETEDGSVTGAFSGLSDIDNPNIVATYHDQGTDGSADDAVSVTYVPVEGSSAPMEGVGVMLETAKTAFGLVNHRLSAVYLDSLLADATPFSGLRLYADAGTVVSDAAWWSTSGSDAQTNGFSLTPYYATIEKDDDPAGYDADVMGFVISYDRQMTDKLFGLHLGYGKSDIDYTGTAASGNTENQDFFSAGVHGMMALGNWTLRGQLAGFIGSHEYEGRTGFNLELTESADYDTNGLGATLMGGYPLTYGKHMLLPEAGLEYLWSDTDGFTTDSGEEMWNISSDAVSDSHVTATASLRWITHKQVGGMTLIPTASAGIRQLLTDEATTVHQSIGGNSPFTVEAVQNKTSGTASASLKLGKKNFSGELSYLGEFGDVATLHEVWLKLSYNF